MQTTTLYRLHILCCASIFLTFLLASCSKEALPQAASQQGDSTNTAGGIPYYSLQKISNLAVPTSDDPSVTEPPILYSLEYQSIQPANYAQTTFWDLSFSGIDNSFLGGNNGSDHSNLGYRGTGKGGITIVAQAFDSVISIPPDNAFNTGTGIIGTDDAGNFGEGLGWYLYDFGAAIVGNGLSSKQHIAYALGDSLKLSNGTTLSPRTVILKAANGDYAKIKMISCYQNAPPIDSLTTFTPHMYFTFEYVIVPAGSARFEIRQ